jgi:hypothetical protein
MDMKVVGLDVGSIFIFDKAVMFFISSGWFFAQKLAYDSLAILYVA